MADKDWRFILQAIDGSGTPGAILHPDLPLTGVTVTNRLNATNDLGGSITPFTPGLLDLLTEWGCCIWAEASGEIRGGGILVRVEKSGSALQLECMGFAGYLHGLPYTDSNFWVQEDPLNIYRHIWSHVQSKPGGNLGLSIDDTVSGLKIGTVLKQVEFDTQSGPISFEAGPYKLNWYDTADLGAKADDLRQDTPFDVLEQHYWLDDVIYHRIELGYPRLGRRLTDLRFVVGENVLVPPSTTRDGDNYANEFLLLGAGTGRTMIKGTAALPRGGRLRRVAVEEAKDIRSVSTANTRAYNLLKARLELEDITELTVLDHAHSPIGSYRPGDEILIQLDYDWQVDQQFWVRILGVALSPDKGTDATLTVIRSDKVT